MRPIKDFCGYWNSERAAIQFKWDVSELENDRYIYIIGIKEEGGAARVDMSQYLLFDVCDMTNASPSTTLMRINNLKVGVYKMKFCAYSTLQPRLCSEEEIIAACNSDESYVTTVMMGRANISYVCDTSVIDNAKIIKIYLKSDSDISEGVLGYRYLIDNEEVINSFPGRIAKGKTVYPSIVIPKDCEIQIGPIDKQFSGNLSITQKKSKLLF